MMKKNFFSDFFYFTFFISAILIFSFAFSILFNFYNLNTLLIALIPLTFLYIYTRPIYGAIFSLYSITYYIFTYSFFYNSFSFKNIFTSSLFIIILHIIIFNFIFYFIGKKLRLNKEIIKKLSDNEKKQSILSALSKNGAVIIFNDKIIEANNYICKLLGYTQEELCSMNFSDIIVSEDVNKFDTTCLNHEYKNTEIILLKKNKDFAPVIVSCAHIEINNISAYAVSIQDISNLKFFEERVLYYKTAMEYSPASIVITDLDGNIEYVNPAFTEKTGYTFEEAFGQNPRILKNASKPSEDYKEMWDDILSGKTWRGEFYNTKKNGEHYWELASISPIIDNSNKIRAFIAVKEDITSRKVLEEELLTAKEKAEQSNRDKSKFVLYVSHEIRSPINGVIGITNLLLDMEKNSEKKEFLHLIKHSANALLEVVNNILDISKIESGKLDLQNILFSVPDTLKNIKSLFSVIAQNKEISLISYIDDNIPDNLYGDYLKFQQIIINLVSNAIKFTEKGKVVIRANVKFRNTETVNIIFSIEDSGIGIPAEMKASIFESFTQVDNIVTRKEKGSGLGLTIVKKMVEILGGKIYLDSEKNEGTTFFVELTFKLNPET